MPQATTVQSVSDVARATEPLAECSPKQAIEALVHSQVEACSEYYGQVVAAPYHPFVAAVHAAFCDHRPLVLAPDMFWLLICQGLARHVNANAENLRRKFVAHDGKEKIAVRRDDFFKGSPDNPWREVFSEFSAQIKDRIGEQNHSNIVASFSTTGAVERAANEIVLMDTMKSYFTYELYTMCGIPEVSLEGTPEDWNELQRRAEALGEAYDLQWWVNRIAPTLQSIARNAEGADDSQLWKNIYKLDDSSGGPYINGWIVDFFPYLQTTGVFHKVSNELVLDWRLLFENPDEYFEAKVDTRNWLFSEEQEGITSEALPSSLCKAPFIWHYLDQRFEMEFIAGFIGFTQHPQSLAVRPKIGWAVREV